MIKRRVKGWLTPAQARALEVKAARVFRPRTPINTRELFAGRRDEINALADAVSQPGLHVVIYGERGVGKTSLANIVEPIIRAFDTPELSDERLPERLVVKQNADSSDDFSSIWHKLFDDIGWADPRPAPGLAARGVKSISLREAFSLPEQLGVSEVRKILARLSGAVFIVDEFDRAAATASHQFTDLIKSLSDFSLDCTVMLVGVADTVDRLLIDHSSIARALVQILLPRMETRELREILSKAEASLSVEFHTDAAELIVRISQGLPHYTHLLGLHAVRIVARRASSQVLPRDVFGALREAVRQAQQSVTDKHSKAIHSAHKDALYRHVLFASALAAAGSTDPLGFFNPAAVTKPLRRVLGRNSIQIATFTNHLNEFCHPKRGEVLERFGRARAYRFRFRDPVLVPFVFMDAVSAGMIADRELREFLEGTF